MTCPGGDSSACTNAKPADAEACTKFSGCRWQVAPWSSCTGSCTPQSRRVECATGRNQDCPGEPPEAVQACKDSRCTKAGDWEIVTFRLSLAFHVPLTEEQELEVVDAIGVVIALGLSVSPSLVTVRKAHSRRLQELATARHLGTELLNLLVEVKEASMADLTFLVSENGRAVVTKQITAEVARRGLPALSSTTLEKAAPIPRKAPRSLPAPGVDSGGGESSGSGIAIVVSILLSVALLVVLAMGSHRFRRKWLKQNTTAHRSVERASLKQVSEESSEDGSDPGSPHAAKPSSVVGRWGAWRRLLKILGISSSNKHRRLRPEAQDTNPEVLQSPSGQFQAKVSQSPMKLFGPGPMLAAKCQGCKAVFDEGEMFCTGCGQRRPEEEVAGQPASSSCCDDESSEGGSTRPPTAGSQSTMATAMSALRGLAQQAEWDNRPDLAATRVPEPARTPEVSQESSSSRGPISWSPVTNLGGADGGPSPRPPMHRPPAWPAPGRSVENIGADAGTRDAKESKRETMAQPSRRRVVPQLGPSPPVPPPPGLLRNEQDDDAEVRKGLRSDHD